MNDFTLIYAMLGIFFSLTFQFLALYFSEKFISLQEQSRGNKIKRRYIHVGWDIAPFVVAYFIILPLYPIFSVTEHSFITLVFYCIFYGFMTLFIVLDIERHWLPLRFTLAFIICGGIYSCVVHTEHIVQIVVASAVLWLALWLFRALSMLRHKRETFGLGDVYLISGLAMWLSWLTTLYVMIVAASIALIVLWIKKNQFSADLDHSDESRVVPFAPFLCAIAAIVAMLPHTAFY